MLPSSAIILINFVALSAALQAEDAPISNNVVPDVTSVDSKPKEILPIGLEPRVSDHNFVRDIVDRLHALDADIGKLIFNSTSMYSPDDQTIRQETSRGSQKFSEVLNDLDALQDEIGLMVTNATRTRQYNILVRLRPLNGILYRIRHNLHLMRNSLVAINTVSSLEKLGNSVLDSTLQAFMRPDANLSDEIGDTGNYEINLDKPEEQAAGVSPAANGSILKVASPAAAATSPSTLATSPPTSSTTPSTTSTTTTTTQAPSTTAVASTPSTTKRTPRPSTRRPQRQNQRRTTQKPSTAKPPAGVSSASIA